MTRSNERRDHELGALLRQLDVPDHDPQFHATLESRIRELQDEAGRIEPVPLRRRAAPPHPRRAATWRWGWAAAATVVAVTVSVIIGGPDGSNTIDVASAAEVRAKVATAWASAENVSGVLVTTSRAAGAREQRRWQFILTARGDVRLTDMTRGGDVAYDADRNVERSLSASESIGEGGAVFASVRRGLAPGWPDPNPADELLDRNLGAVVRALLAGGQADVEEAEYADRPVWVLETEIRPNLIVPRHSPNFLAVTIDQQTGFPLRIVASHDDRVVWTTRINNLRVDTQVADDAFRLRFPRGVDVFRSDAGFRTVSVDEVEDRVSYRPLLPTDIPEGFVLAELRVSDTPTPTGTEAGNPAVGDIVSAVYRRGLDHFLVTTRPTGPDASNWDDPLASGEGYVDDPEVVRLSDGALKGERGELLIDPLAIPHIWVVTPQLVVTVSGDLSSADLLRVAESLEQAGS